MVVSSSFFDGSISSYAPSLPEIGLGLGGVAMTGLIVLIGIKMLRFLPTSLANATIDPHHEVTTERP
jgi:molybdopterin-containing oxidoreductase family membrane subunit